MNATFTEIDEVHQSPTVPVDVRPFDIEGWMVKAKAGPLGVEVVIEDTTTPPCNLDEVKVYRLWASWTDLADRQIAVADVPRLIRTEVLNLLSRHGQEVCFLPQ